MNDFKVRRDAIASGDRCPDRVPYHSHTFRCIRKRGHRSKHRAIVQWTKAVDW